MAKYHLSPGLTQLRNEINVAWPNRDKASDGWIGDTAHAARKSDHNPDWDSGGVVRALDVDKDGIDIDALWRTAKDDGRVEYIIWAHHIATRANGFIWARYKGINPHDKHMHISTRHDPHWDNLTVQWNLARFLGGPSLAPAAPAPAGRKSVEQIAQEVLSGSWGNNPERSRRLQAAGYSPTEVQAAVNALVGGNRPVVVRESIGVIADQVIRGQWGIGVERRRRLTASGYNYDQVQAEVNRKLR